MQQSRSDRGDLGGSRVTAVSAVQVDRGAPDLSGANSGPLSVSTAQSPRRRSVSNMARQRPLYPSFSRVCSVSSITLDGALRSLHVAADTRLLAAVRVCLCSLALPSRLQRRSISIPKSIWGQ